MQLKQSHRFLSNREFSPMSKQFPGSKFVEFDIYKQTIAHKSEITCEE